MTASPEPHADAAARSPPLLQLLAILGTPQSKTQLFERARALQLTDANGRALKAKDVSDVLLQALEDRQVMRSNDRFACTLDFMLVAFKAAVLGGQLARWCEPLLMHLRVLDARGALLPGFAWEENAAIAIRVGVFAGRKHLLQQLLQARWAQHPLDLARCLNGYVDAELLDTCELDFAAALATQLLEHGLEVPHFTTQSVCDWAMRYISSSPVSPQLRLVLILQLAWRMRFEEAAALVAESHWLADLVQANTAAMQGRYVQALPNFERAAAALPVDAEGKRTRLPAISAWLRVAAMIASDDPEQLEAAAKLCRKLSRDSAGRWFWKAIQCVISARSGEPVAPAWFTISGVSLLDDLTQAIAYAWLRQRPDSHSKSLIENWVGLCESVGYLWPARELRACLAMWERQQPALSLAAAFLQETTWQRALATIAALQGEPEAAAAEETRIAWLVQLAERGTVERIEPWMQKRSSKGWNRGKKVALSTLVRDEALAPLDMRVVRAARPATGVGYELDVHRALRALIGHPLVFFDEDLTTPVELTAAEPELIVSRREAGTQLILQPSAGEIEAAFDLASIRGEGKSASDPCLVRRHAAHSAQIILLTPTHRRIAKLLGNVMDIPADAEQLQAALAGAARHCIVHTDADGLSSEAPAADATLRAELSPRGAGLRLQLIVRPFGVTGPRYTPGRGAARVFTKIEGQPRVALRNLDAEHAAAQEVIAALEMCAVDADILQVDCEQPVDCLELLEVLQGMSSVVQVDWPAGVKYRVSRSYGVEDLKVSLGRSNDWFVADGGLQLDDGTVLELRRLLDAARSGHGRFVPLGEDGFVALGENLARRLNELALLDDAKSGAAKLPLTAALALADATDGMQLQGSAQWREAVERIREAQALQPELPSTLQAQLRPYQLEGFRWLARLAHWGGGACLADDMGLGKTLQALALLLMRAPQGPALVVAPTSVCQNWLDEARRFAPALRAQWFTGAERTALLAAAGPFDVLVCSYTLLQQDIEGFTAKAWHSVVLDEAQAVKNFSTKRAQAVLALPADFRLAVTGTPVENRLEELWMVFRFLNPGLLGSRERFAERFGTPIERSNDAATRSHLRRLITPFMLRRTKSEVLTELPPRTEITLAVEPEADERAFHEALRQSALEVLADASVPANRKRFQVLAELMRVRRACCHPQLIAPEASVGSAKLKAFLELVTELIANRHKALVFSQFVDHLTLLRTHLDAAGVRYQYLDGSTPAAERSQRVRAFQGGEGDLFLISLRAGGVGLNLTAADYVIITDPWWNPAVEDQAASRAHRMGQERPVTVYRLVVKDSIEERIMQLHAQKRALAEGLFSGEEFGGAWSVEDLLQLLRDG